MIDPVDVQLCQLSQNAYLAAADTGIVLDAGGDVHAVVTPLDGIQVVAFRGTVPASWEDWFRDLEAWPHASIDHPLLGRCHEGFLSGAEAILPKILPLLSAEGSIVLTGHSLGGALAILTAGLLTIAGRVPARLTTFGAPRVGIGPVLGGLLKDVPGVRFRHGDDPVPTVPGWPYANDRDWTPVGTAGFPRIEDHMIAGYLRALDDGT